jgi:hypothetical protein
MSSVTRCPCGSESLEPVLSLGSSPPTCAMLPVGSRQAETHYPLDLLRCPDCTLVQLGVIPDRDEVFPPDYPYSSGNSPQLRRNFAHLADDIGRRPDQLIVDIGANDGTLLRNFHRQRTIGVEPTGQAQKISGPKYQEFFSEKLAKKIVAQHGQADIVTACNVLAHVDDIDDVMRGIAHLLAPPTHGGSFRMFARKGSRNLDMPKRVEHSFDSVQRSAEQHRRFMRQATANGPVYGIGATARATTVINYCGLDVEDIECVCEVPGSDKIGRYIPGTRIPVVSEQRLIEDQPSRTLLFSWHLADSIVPNLRDRGYRGDIVLVNNKEATHAPSPALA